MKQLLLLSSDVYPSELTAYDATKIPVGQIAVMQNGSIVTSVASLEDKNFTILYRKSKDAQVKNFDVDYNSLSIVKSVSQASKAKKMTVTVPATVAKETYSFTIVKKGKTFNERINYSYSEYAKADGKQADVAAALAKVVNANTENTGVKATVSAAVITLENVVNEDFNVVSELCTVATTQDFAPAILDADYVKDLAQRCIGGKGIQYLAEDGKELYHILYATREDSSVFLENLNLDMIKSEDVQKDNIDFYHMANAFRYIDNWIKNDGKIINQRYNLGGSLDTVRNSFFSLLNGMRNIKTGSVQVLWYELAEDKEKSSVKEFQKINTGKIRLTDAELIKGLFLLNKNFEQSSKFIKQSTLAIEWEFIENTLHANNFWYFLQKKGTDMPNRIDLLFSLIYKKHILSGLEEEE